MIKNLYLPIAKTTKTIDYMSLIYYKSEVTQNSKT
jgi:hypothetical protein